MSTLQVANVWFESTANNRIQYNGSGVALYYAGSNNVMNVASDGVTIPVVRTSNIVFESTANNKITYDVTSGITFSQGLNNIMNFYTGPLNVMNVASAGVTIPTLVIPATGTTAASNSNVLVKLSSANTQQNNFIGNYLRLNLSNAAINYHNADLVYNYGGTTDNTNTSFSIQQSNSAGGFIGFIMKANFKDQDLQLYTAASSRLSINSTGAVTIPSNTLSLGTSSVATSGYTYLPNGLKMNWGVVVPNTFGINLVSFSSPFTTNAFAVNLTVRTDSGGGGANVRVATVNSVITKTGFNLLTVNASGGGSSANVLGVYYMAIGD